MVHVSKKTIISASDDVILKLKVLAKEKEETRRKLEITAKELAATAKEKGEVLIAILNVLDDLQVEREKLAQAKARDEAIISSIGDGMIVTDQNARVIVMNEAIEKLTGWKREEIIGKSWFEVMPMEDEKGNAVPDDKRPIQQAISHRKSTTTTTTKGQTYYYIRKDRTRFPVAITVTPIIINDQISGAIGVFRDITHEIEIDKAKSEFISLASHQLRTPLGIVKWYLDVLQKKDYLQEAPKVMQEYFDEIYKNNERALSLVRDLLSVSRIDQGRVKDVPKPVNILEIITDTVMEMQILAKSKKVTLYLKLPAQTLPSIYIDPLRFHEVIENLVANAIEYTQALGKVEVTVDKNNDTVTVSIQDTGMGISEADKGKLFDKFFRSEKAIGYNSEGSGLGLYVVKSYVEGWGGKISVESSEGKGSTFVVILPITQKKDILINEQNQ